MQFLNEQTMLSEFHKTDSEVREGVLHVIEGPLANWKPNRNHRTYPRRLWEQVMNSEYIKDMMDNKTLLGEADHPEERTSISIQNVSHAIRKMWINEQTQELWGTIDILDTPLGNLVARLLDYGSKIGVSSRGVGDVDANNQVVPDTYTFFTFDLVARPSVAVARPELIESEQLSEEQVQSLIESYRGNSVISNKSDINYYDISKKTLMSNINKRLILECDLNR